MTFLFWSIKDDEKNIKFVGIFISFVIFFQTNCVHPVMERSNSSVACLLFSEALINLLNYCLDAVAKSFHLHPATDILYEHTVESFV